jgi:hypothetical protein
MNDSEAKEGRGQTCDLAREHLRQLIQRGQVEYEAFDSGEDAKVLASGYKRACTALAEIIDVNRLRQLGSSKRIRKAWSRILALDFEDRALVVETWARCLRETGEDWRAARAVCSKFASIVDALPRKLDSGLACMLVELVRYQKEDAFHAVADLMDGWKTLTAAEHRKRYVDFLEGYFRYTSSRTLTPLAKAASLLIKTTDQDPLAILGSVCSPNVMKTDKYAGWFLKALCSGLETVHESNRRRYLDLCLATAAKSCGSASSVAVDVPKKLGGLNASLGSEYLDGFRRLVENVGICVVGRCLGSFYRRCAAQDSARIRQYVDLVCQVSSEYGKEAAFAFVEGKTRVSAEF